MSALPLSLQGLRDRLAAIEGRAHPDAPRFLLGAPGPDAALGGLSTRALHEIYADNATEIAPTFGFSALMADRADPLRPSVWVMQSMVGLEGGEAYAPGLVELGLDPARIVLVKVKDVGDLLRAVLEAVRCPGVGTVLGVSWAAEGRIDLTVGRRMALAAREARSTLFMVRCGADPTPSPAETRWRVRAAASRALEAGAPGPPAFHAALIRNRSGLPEQAWTLEWDLDRRSFVDPASISGDRLRASARRPAVAHGLRLAG